MKNTHFYKLIVLLLVLINLATLSSIWFRRPPNHSFHKGKPPISEIISLTGQAKIIVDSLEKQHHQNKQAMIRLDRELHHQFFDSLGNENHPVELQNKLDSNKSEIEHLTFEFFNDVFKNCDEEQKIQLKEFINRAIINVHHRPRNSTRPHIGRHQRRQKH
jgi:hypothetical protein